MQLGFGERSEIHRDFQILVEHLHRIHAADRSCNRQTHRITEPLLRCDRTMLHQFPAAAKALHAQSRDPTPIRLRQNLCFEAAEGRIATVERHLHGIERKIVGQHSQVNLGIFVPGESDKPHFTLLLGSE